MKRVLLAVLLCVSLPVFAQDAGRAAALAENQRSEERFQRMTADLESLQAANASLARKVSALEESLQKAREEQARQANNSSVPDDMKKLAERIQEVDKKRENDKQVILEEFKSRISKLERAWIASGGGGGGSKTTTTVTAPPDTEPAVGETYTYVIQPNNTLPAIVKAYNEEFKKKGMKTITRAQVMEANPKVNWDKLRIGQKILIPKPGN